MYHVFMNRRSKQWIALLLLTFTVTTAHANACSVVCALTHVLASAAASPCHHEGSTGSGPGAQAQFCAFAAAPALCQAPPAIDSPRAVYVSPLPAIASTGLDPPPPLKPPPD